MQGPIEQLLRRSVADLDSLAVRYAMVGGLAFGMRAEPRFTRDIDFTIAVDTEHDAEAVTGKLIVEGYFPQYEIANRITGKLATFRMRHKRSVAGLPVDESPFIDLLFSHCGIEREVVETATHTEPFEGLVVPTARLPHLIAMKVLAESDERLQDRIDLKHLILAATDADLTEVPPLLDLITQRGFAQDKDLHAVYGQFLSKR